MVLKVSLNTGINRIRLEFKEDHSCFLATKTARVLIESDWNLKSDDLTMNVAFSSVLIESDWNLKRDRNILKCQALSINRIRLEFKGDTSSIL